MAFGKRKSNDDVDEDDRVDAPSADDDELDGPFDIDDFDDPSAAALARLDLGSVLIPMPEAGQVQVELTETGVPSAVWVVTPNGRFTIAAYAAPKTAGLWREVATELADSLRKDVRQGQHRGRAVGSRGGRRGQGGPGPVAGVVRFIGVDGYRWMIRCVVNGPQDRSTRWPTKREMRWRTRSFGAETRRCRSAPRCRCSCPSRWRPNCARPPSRRRPAGRAGTASSSRHRRSPSRAAARRVRRCSSCAPSRAASARRGGRRRPARPRTPRPAPPGRRPSRRA